MSRGETKVVNVKVAHLRPKYKDLKEWMEASPNHVYIGRRGIVFIENKRFPTSDSIWHNPFKAKDDTIQERRRVCEEFEVYIRKKLNEDKALVQQLIELRGKQLGCWCAPLECHGDVLKRLINEYEDDPTREKQEDVETETKDEKRYSVKDIPYWIPTSMTETIQKIPFAGHRLFHSRASKKEDQYLSPFTPTPKPIPMFPLQELVLSKAPRSYETIVAYFPTMEHAFQACKWLYTTTGEHWDQWKRYSIDGDIGRLSASEAKSMSSKSAFKKAGIQLNLQSWNRESLRVMFRVALARYKIDEPFRKMLETYRASNILLLHHESRKRASDLFWGASVVLPKADTDTDTISIVGPNHLGWIYMYLSMTRSNSRPSTVLGKRKR